MDFENINRNAALNNVKDARHLSILISEQIRKLALHKSMLDTFIADTLPYQNTLDYMVQVEQIDKYDPKARVTFSEYLKKMYKDEYVEEILKNINNTISYLDFIDREVEKEVHDHANDVIDDFWNENE